MEGVGRWRDDVGVGVGGYERGCGVAVVVAVGGAIRDVFELSSVNARSRAARRT